MANIVKRETVEAVQNRISQLSKENKLNLPAEYSVGNAMNSAWLKLQETKDRSGNPVLQVCTQTSIMNSLLKMAIMGLSPMKDQCYFVAYGKNLTMQRSYLGSMAIVKRLDGVKDVVAQCIYKGEEPVLDIKEGHLKIVKHQPDFAARMDENNIIATYCVISFTDGREPYHELMSLDQVKAAWSQGQIYKLDGSHKKTITHEKFKSEMVMKTVINRATKKLINSSSDKENMRGLIEALNDESEMIANEQAEEANSIDFQEYEEVDNHEAETPKENKPESKPDKPKTQSKTTNTKTKTSPRKTAESKPQPKKEKSEPETPEIPFDL